MNYSYIGSTAVLLFLLMDPFGNLPFFIGTLRGVAPQRYPRIVLRESLIALAMMICMLYVGGKLLRAMHVSSSSLGIAGGVILLLLAIKMVFSTLTLPESETNTAVKEPLIVPLAIPMICGPALIAMLIMLRSDTSGTLAENTFAVFLAWLPQTAVLLSGRPLSRILGAKALDALESLMGLLLACISIEMLVSGIRTAFAMGGGVQ